MVSIPNGVPSPQGAGITPPQIDLTQGASIQDTAKAATLQQLSGLRQFLSTATLPRNVSVKGFPARAKDPDQATAAHQATQLLDASGVLAKESAELARSIPILESENLDRQGFNRAQSDLVAVISEAEQELLDKKGAPVEKVFNRKATSVETEPGQRKRIDVINDRLGKLAGSESVSFVSFAEQTYNGLKELGVPVDPSLQETFARLRSHV